MLCVPSNITSVESRAVHEADVAQAPARCFDSAALSCLVIDLPIAPPSGSMVISMVAALTRAAVIAMNSIISSGLDKTGGLQMDEDIISYLRKNYGLVLSRAAAETAKMRIGAAVKRKNYSPWMYKGRIRLRFAQNSNDQHRGYR